MAGIDRREFSDRQRPLERSFFGARREAGVLRFSIHLHQVKVSPRDQMAGPGR